VFLLDVSGSMGASNKLPLLKHALSMLVQTLEPRDRVAIVVYAGASGMVLPPTPGHEKNAILGSLSRLGAGGSTNGGAGIELAYRLAQDSFIPGAVNRVILATDGDFNVGVTDRGALMRLIEQKRQSGVFLTVLGLGMGNLKDATMEQLADKGNGNYAYIDSIDEAKKVLVTEAGATLVTIAKDVKVQVAFDPEQVASYRLIGYENRKLDDRDFADDTKDAGEIGAGHSVTALYEIELTEAAAAKPADAPMLTIALRYKDPDGEVSRQIERAVGRGGQRVDETSDNFRFAAAVAGFGMLLRNSSHKGGLTWSGVRQLAAGAVGADPHGWRKQFLGLVDRAAQLAGPSVNQAAAAR
jgi:Ca-activated chloride channel family protein